jgi:hypothetical protein
MSLLFMAFISMIIPREHEIPVVSEEEEEQGDKGKKTIQGENDPLTSPQSTLIPPFISMLIPRAYKCNKSESPKHEEWKRCSNERIRTSGQVNLHPNQRWVYIIT